MKRVHWMTWLFASLVLASASPALAQQECTTNDECPAGFSCVVLPCACAPDQDCTDCQGGYCMEDSTDPIGDCLSDADCADGMVCEFYTTTCDLPLPCDCACPGCEAGQECPPCECACPTPDPDCGTTTYGYCMLPPEPPQLCLSDTDCPDGFVCAMTDCACPQGAECDCAAEGYCVEKWEPTGECTSDADCTDGMYCEIYDVPCADTCECACPGCPEGESCPPCECDECIPLPCEPATTGYCTYPPEPQVPCAADSDCPEGYLCALSTCACPPDAECDCDIQGVCVADYRPKDECQTDADCPTGLTCERVEEPCAVPLPCSCSCEACPEGAECPPCECPDCNTDAMPCEPISYGICTFQPAECNTNADCQAGFECKPQEECMGMGCACAPCAEGAECEPCDCPAEPVEECHVIGSYCEPIETPCTTNNDCLAGWECVEFGIRSDCPSCACMEGTDCECPPCTTELESKCLPEGWRDYMDTDDTGIEEGETPEPTDPTVEPPVVDDGNGNTDPTPTTPTGNGNGATDSGNADPGYGCNAGGQASPYALLLLGSLLVGLFACGRLSRVRREGR